jgi:hypothetical protein
MINCTRCQQELQHPVFINGLPYGQDCGAKVLGFEKMPSWFNDKPNQDYYIQKKNHEELQANNAKAHEARVEITRKYWSEYYILSSLFVKFRQQDNDWGMNFIFSISNQLGYASCMQSEESLFDSFDKAVNNWEGYMGTFPLFSTEPKRISDLSPKQQSILNKYL